MISCGMSIRDLYGDLSSIQHPVGTRKGFEPRVRTEALASSMSCAIRFLSLTSLSIRSLSLLDSLALGGTSANGTTPLPRRVSLVGLHPSSTTFFVLDIPVSRRSLCSGPLGGAPAGWCVPVALPFRSVRASIFSFYLSLSHSSFLGMPSRRYASPCMLLGGTLDEAIVRKPQASTEAVR
jgi:hypothetical protein